MTLAFSLRRAVAVARVETLELVRDPAALCLIFLLPVMQILLYGYAINPIHDNARLALSGDADAYISQVTDWAKTSPDLKTIGPAGAPGAAEAAVRAGKASIGLEMDEGPLGLVSFKVYADGSDPATTRPALAALETAYWRATQTLQDGSAPAATPPVTWLFNPTQIASWSIVPGLVGVIVMISMLFLGAMVLVRERERGTWEGLLATPVRPGEALVGKLAPYLVIGVGQTAILIAVIHLLFQVPLPVQGWALIAASTLLAGAYLILGFALSAITQNQLQAVQAAVGVYLPSLLLSGFLFPFQTMPAWAQAVGRLLPLTYYIRATRSLLIRGEPLSTLPADLWPIALFGLASLVVALLAYRRRLD